MSERLIELAQDIDRPALAEQFARTGMVQIPGWLTDRSARRVRQLLESGTPWGLAWFAGREGEPELIRGEQLAALQPQRAARIQAALKEAMAGRDYAFCYSAYPLVQALLERWDPGGRHEQLLTEINAPDTMTMVRQVTGIATLVKADGQATLYRPGHFLARHDDDEPSRGRRVAYVMNFCGDPDGDPWRPEWGGMLQFLDEEGRPDGTLLPGFNVLNLFAVPRGHHVTSVASFAPATRYAVTGWFRDR